LRAEFSGPETPVGVVVLCHPHPLHGGNMYAGIVDHLFRELPQSDIAVLRFNFRGVSGSDGRHDNGIREQFDVLAAVDEAGDRVPDRPLVLAGWSFGGDMALVCPHPAITSWCAIAPPLRLVDPATMAAATDTRPCHLLVPEFDQFAPPPLVAERTVGWSNAHRHTLQRADHFLGGAEQPITEFVVGLFSS
jgi:alpha/beta superfamily hydrolase